MNRHRHPAQETGTSTPTAGIGQVAIVVSDVDLALAFYPDILGLEFLFRPAHEWAFLAAGELRLMLTTPPGTGAPGANSALYFKVAGIEGSHAGFVGHGAVEERAPQAAAEPSDHTPWLSFLRDPNGNLVGLMEKRR